MYVNSIDIDVDTRCTILQYLRLISKRASGERGRGSYSTSGSYSEGEGLVQYLRLISKRASGERGRGSYSTSGSYPRERPVRGGGARLVPQFTLGGGGGGGGARMVPQAHIQESVR